MVRNCTLTACLILLCAVGNLSGQIFEMDGSPILTCGGYFTDSGGVDAGYQNNQNFTTVICSDNSSGSHIKLEMQNIDIEQGDTLCFYDDSFANPAKLLTCNWEFFNGEVFNIQATAANTSGCLTVTFKSNSSERRGGWAAEMSCVRSCQTIQANIVSTDPVIFPADTGWIDICPGDEVFFSGMGEYPQSNLFYPQSDQQSNFTWDFGDGSIENGMNVSKIFDKPGGYIVTLVVEDQTGCTNSNYIKQRVRVAPSPMFNLGNLDQQLCAGDTISLTSSISGLGGGDVSAQASSESFGKGSVRSDSLALPDGTGTSYETSIEFTDFGPGQVLTNINDLESICVNIEHSWMRDMEITITCPNGTEVKLHNHPGNAGGMVLLGEPIDLDGTNPIPGVGYDYCWTPDATRGNWIEYANRTFSFFGAGTLPSGNYNSYENLNKLVGCPLNGEWTIKVTDLWKEDNGFIFSWSINFARDLYPDLEEFSPELTAGNWLLNGTILSSSTESLLASPDNAGNVEYTYEVMDEFGCVWDTLVNFELFPETHPDCYTCKKFNQPLEDEMVCEGATTTLDASPGQSNNFLVKFESFPNELIAHDFYPPAAPFDAVIEVMDINPNVLSDPGIQIESICFDLETDFTADIQISLQGPTGRELVLTRNIGNMGGYTQTCFSPGATQPISSGTDPFTGNFIPEGNWADLAGERINGDWKLRVSDAAGFGEFGILNSWSIGFNTEVDITYSWNNPSLLSCNNCPNPEVDIAAPTTFLLETTDNFGCKYTDQADVEFFSAPAPTLNCESNDFGQIEIDWATDPDIDFYEINIDNTGWTQVSGNSYSYGNFTSGDISNIEIRAFYGDVSCLSKIASSTCQFVKCEIRSTADVNQITCRGSNDGSVEIAPALGFGNYEFSLDGSNYQTDNNFSNLAEGNYTGYVLDELGCSDTIGFQIANPVLFDLELEVLNNVSCFGGADGEISANATGGVSPYQYAWNDSQNQIDSVAKQLIAGNYTVTVIDANGCEVIESTRITEPFEIRLSLEKTDVPCTGEPTGTATAVFTGGVTPFRFLWNDPAAQTTATAENLLAGTYTVTITDANNCTKVDFVTLDEPTDALEVTTLQTEKGCDGSSKNEAQATPTGGTGSYDYLWDNGFDGRDVTNLSAGEHIVIITDQNGCEVSDTIFIENLPPIVGNVGNTLPTCNGSTDGIIAVTNVTGGSPLGVYNFEWSNGGTQEFIDNLKGEETYRVTITDNAGCEGIEEIFLNQPDSLKLNMESVAAKCYNSADGAATVIGLLNTGSDIAPIESYAWNTSAGSQITPTATGLSSGFYQVTVRDTNGCEGYGSAFVSQPTEIVVKSQTTDNNCFGETKGAIEVNISGGTPAAGDKKYGLEWSNGEFGNVLEDLPAGNYILSVTDDNDCRQIEAIEVNEAEAINATVETVDVLCNGGRNGEIEINATGGSGGFKYSVRDDFFTGSNRLIGLNAGTYEVIVEDRFGCRWYENTTIGQPDPMIVDAGPDLIEIDLGDSISLIASSANAVGDVDFEWGASYNGLLSCDFCPQTSLYPMSTVFVTLFGEDENGCNNEDRIEIRVLKERKVFVPTGFTPNSDNTNDRLLIHGAEGTTIKLFRVFDRWGELLFEAKDFPINDPNIGWDGLFRAKNSNSGVYSWYLEVEYMDGAVDALRGETTLIR